MITEEDGIVATFIKKLINNWQLEKAINNTWKYYTIFINLKEKYKYKHFIFIFVSLIKKDKRYSWYVKYLEGKLWKKFKLK